MSILSTCCFIGGQKISQRIIGQVLLRLHHEVEALIKKGITTFLSSGAPGFEQIAASLIVAKRETGKQIRLNFILPCREQTYYWNREQSEFYNKLLAEADEVIYLAERYYSGCIRKQKHFVVDHSSYCICALPNPIGIAGKKIRYAKKKGLTVINIIG